jgi:hypothetical protein
MMRPKVEETVRKRIGQLRTSLLELGQLGGLRLVRQRAAYAIFQSGASATPALHAATLGT